ncbi:zinc transporter ZIP1 isoform X2 [Agrilus planipennis]|uniref:Zinc transporter ZIP1 isoform X2 n=1 Tax=Agrilus planipennis TaxID=224129 RepID=A0A1W4X9V4_AGRPL|nr:zinc transporter ZIP1 isoform X2 [Agrilus planipennis]
MVDYSTTPFYEDDHHYDHDHDHDSNGVTVAKIVTMCVLFFTSFIVGTSPLYIPSIFHWKLNIQNSKLVTRLLCFGGGILLCTTFLHLLPEVSEKIKALQSELIFLTSENYEIHYAELLMCCGFFVLYFVEEAIHCYLHSREKDNLVNNLTRSFSIRRGDDKIPTKSIPLRDDLERNVDVHTHVDHSHNNFDNSFLKSFRGFLIVLALSVHELFEGLAVGLESSTNSVWYMFGAVSAHKIVIAFCIGVELIVSDISKLLTIFYVFTFAIVSPLGIGIGIALSEDQKDSTEVVSVVLQGLASGTLLYIVFFEILRTDRRGGLKTFFAVFLGFGLMLCTTVFIPHGHSHSHSHSH